MTAAAATCEALLEMEGQMLGNRSSLGEEGTLAHLLALSVSHCQFMFQILQQLVRMVLYLGCKGQRAVLTIWCCDPRLDKSLASYQGHWVQTNCWPIAEKQNETNSAIGGGPFREKSWFQKPFSLFLTRRRIRNQEDHISSSLPRTQSNLHTISSQLCVGWMHFTHVVVLEQARSGWHLSKHINNLVCK